MTHNDRLQHNKELVRRWFEEVWNQQRAESIDELLTPEARIHGQGEDLTGPQDFRRFHSAYLRAFPDVRLQIEDLIAEGDTVAARWTGVATHLGDGLGFPATGRTVRFQGMVFVQIQDGRFGEGWNHFDRLGMLEQLGLGAKPEAG